MIVEKIKEIKLIVEKIEEIKLVVEKIEEVVNVDSHFPKKIEHGHINASFVRIKINLKEAQTILSTALSIFTP